MTPSIPGMCTSSSTRSGRVFFFKMIFVAASAESADIISTLAKLPFTAFGEGTDKGMPQRAKPEVWKEAAKFKTAADTMVTEVAKLDAAAKAGNLDAIKAAMGGVGKSCKACHDDFRAEKYSN